MSASRCNKYPFQSRAEAKQFTREPTGSGDKRRTTHTKKMIQYVCPFCSSDSNVVWHNTTRTKKENRVEARKYEERRKTRQERMKSGEARPPTS